ncbi:Oxysterol-binding protein-related protein 1 [Sarcoptes scabiei]|uniref:Oxysterol-binding protein-related protein 1 n=1 Tax=Sarcoptes scabiei TaxID=52283 RepID=A0A834RCZ5_SARSC|nr:Oxysterol-binding protein-related protein 1 [Sarcoptes scabiei]
MSDSKKSISNKCDAVSLEDEAIQSKYCPDDDDQHQRNDPKSGCPPLKLDVQEYYDINEDDLVDFETAEEFLLHFSRSGQIELVKKLLNLRNSKEIALNIDFKGQSKANFGWSSLHLATYFGHSEVVDLLLKNGADVDIQNEDGDTPLHKAAYTGRENIIHQLIQSNANVFIQNGEGLRAFDLAKTESIHQLLLAAEQSDIKRREKKFLSAARNGDLPTLKELLEDANSCIDINTMDSAGNTALHCAAYRGQNEIVIFLIKNGIDTTIKNKRGQLAANLASTVSLKQIIQKAHYSLITPKVVAALKIKSVNRFEGFLFKKGRFFGWRLVWAVLERGVFSFFSNRYHIDDSDDDDEAAKHLSPVSIQEMITTANAHQKILERHIKALELLMDDETLLSPMKNCDNQSMNESLHSQTSIDSISRSIIPSIKFHLNLILESSKNANISLQQCLSRQMQIKQEEEKCRFLEEALQVLAREHYDLERSISKTIQQQQSNNSSSTIISPLSSTIVAANEMKFEGDLRSHNPNLTRSFACLSITSGTDIDEYYDAFDDEFEIEGPQNPTDLIDFDGRISNVNDFDENNQPCQSTNETIGNQLIANTANSVDESRKKTLTEFYTADENENDATINESISTLSPDDDANQNEELADRTIISESEEPLFRRRPSTIKPFRRASCSVRNSFKTHTLIHLTASLLTPSIFIVFVLFIVLILIGIETTNSFAAKQAAAAAVRRQRFGPNPV